MQGLPKIGDVLDDTYRIEKLVGTGGFGAVYLAKQISMDREVALKILVANAMNIDEMVQRFRREVMACRNLGHPNTIRIYDFRDRPDGILYYTMEFVDGPTLKDVIKDNGPISPRRVSHILKQICKSLAEAHSFGIVHRDLKPANIMLANIAGETDFVKVVDFGIAKIVDGEDGEDRDQLTNAGVLVGTLNYMSPEQIQGGDITPVSDLYALGLITIEMLMGRSVFEGTGRWEVLHKQISDDPVDIPQEVLDSPLGPVLQKALEKQATKRYAKAEEILRALNDLPTLSDSPLIAVDTTAAPEPKAQISGIDKLPMPESRPVESELPLPEPVRPMRTKSLEETTSPEDDAPAREAAPAVAPVKSAAPDLGNKQAADRQPMVSPVQQPARGPMVTPAPGNGFVPSGDTDVGPAPGGNAKLIGIAVVVLLLVVSGIGIVASMSGGDDVEPDATPGIDQPVNPPVVAVNNVGQPTEPDEPTEPNEPTEPDEPAVATPTKTIRLVTPGVKAQLFHGDELIGTTNLRFPVSAKKVYTLKAEGYEDQVIELSHESEDLVELELTRIAVAATTKRDPTPPKETVTPKETKPPKETKKDGWIEVPVKKTEKKDVPVF